MELYSQGNEHANITGGWGAAEGGGDATIKDGYMEMLVTNSSKNRKHVATRQKIDLTGFNKLCATVEFTECRKLYSQDPTLRIGIGSSYETSLASVDTKTEQTNSSIGVKNISYNIAGLNEAKYVIVGIGWPYAAVKVTRVWLEV